MKRSFNTTENSNSSVVKANAVLEGVIVTVTNLLDNHDKKGKYWSALLCDSNQCIIRITKYLSSKTKCSLHEKILDYCRSKNGIKLNKLKFTSDDTYVATHETVAIPKVVSFTPSCMQLSLIQDIESMSDGQYISFICKIIDVGPDDMIIFNNGPKRVQKLKRTIIIADKSGSMDMNIWENQFNSIKENLSYTIRLAKVKVFNDEVSVTTTTHTMFELMEDIGDINCPESAHIPHELTTNGTITSIGLVKEHLVCPKCYSNEIENNEKTIKCLTCKSRTLNVKENIDRNQIKLTVINTNQQSFEFIVEISKLKTLLEQANHKELCQEDLVEHEGVLLALSSINISVMYNPRNKHINDIKMNNVED